MTKGPLLQAAWDELPEERKRNIQTRIADRIQVHTLQESPTVELCKWFPAAQDGQNERDGKTKR